MRAAVYTRFSMDDRGAGRTDADSVAIQQENARRACAAQGWEVAAVFTDDGYSGAEIHGRPRLQALLDSATRQEFDVIVVRDLDRIARDAARQTALLSRLDDAGVKVWTYSDRGFVALEGFNYLFTAFRGVVAEEERRATSRRVRESMRRRAELGQAIFRAPFGYRIEGERFVIVEEQAEIIRRMAERFAAGGSIRGIANDLNTRGIASPAGKLWDGRVVSNMLKNALCRGQLRFGERRKVYEKGTARTAKAAQGDILVVERPELRIIDAETAAKIDTQFAGHRRAAGAATPKHLASGFVRCGLCGASVTAHAYRGRYRKNRYTCARNQNSGRAACAGIGGRPEYAVDAAVLQAVRPLLDGDVAESALKHYRKRLEARVRGQADPDAGVTRREIAACERKLDNYARAIGLGDPPETIVRAMKTEEDRLGKLRSALVRAEQAGPVRLDVEREVRQARTRLRDLMKLAERGGVAARPVIQAMLGGARFQAFPVATPEGRRWQLTAKVAGGYLSNVVTHAKPSS